MQVRGVTAHVADSEEPLVIVEDFDPVAVIREGFNDVLEFNLRLASNLSHLNAVCV